MKPESIKLFRAVAAGMKRSGMRAVYVLLLGGMLIASINCDDKKKETPTDTYVDTVITPVSYANIAHANSTDPVSVGNVSGVRMPGEDVSFDNCNINAGQVDLPASKAILTGKYKMTFVPTDGDFVELETLLQLDEHSYSVFEGDKGVYLIPSDTKSGYDNGVFDLAYVCNHTDGSQPGPDIDTICIYDVSQFEETDTGYIVANTDGMSSERIEHIKKLAAMNRVMTKGKSLGTVLLESKGEISADDINANRQGRAYFFNKTNPNAGIDLGVNRDSNSDILDADYAIVGMKRSSVDGALRLGQITKEMETILYGDGLKVLTANHGRRTIGEDNMPLPRTIDIFSQMYLHPSGMTFEYLGGGLYRAIDARILRDH